MSVASVDQVAAAISQFEEATDHRDFRLFHIELARKFKRLLAETVSPTTGKPLATATVCSRLLALKAFFIWLAGQPGYKSRMNYSDADYFNPSNNDSRIANAVRQRPAPTMEQVRHVIARMPTDTDIQKRDRALVAFTILSGARDNAIASMSLRHVDVALCRSPEAFKAWSQNLGHEHVLTTFTSYGEVAQHRQAEILNSLSGNLLDLETKPDADSLQRAIAYVLKANA